MKTQTAAFFSKVLLEDRGFGIGVVTVLRRKGGARIEAGVFLVDPTCLGVRDAWLEVLDEAELPETMERLFDGEVVEKEAAWGREFVEGAVDYARRLGFAPHRDYKKACRVFGGIDPRECEESFTYGKNGKPFYIQGPNDSPEQTRRILRQLHARCGDGGYDFFCKVDETEILDQTVEDLIEKAQAGAPEESTRELEKLLGKHPESPSVHFALGAVHGLQRNHAASVKHSQEAVRLKPNMAEAWFNLAMAYKEALRTTPMTRAFMKAVEFADPEDEFVAQAQEFVDIMAKAAREDSGLDLETYLKSGDLFDKACDTMERGEWENAIEEFRAVLRVNPRSNQSHGNIGGCLMQLGRIAEAREALREALRIRPDYEIARRNLHLLEAVDENNPPRLAFNFENRVPL